MIDPLIMALIGKLPKPDTMWRVEDRARWLNAMALSMSLSMSLVYTDRGGDHALAQPEIEARVVRPTAHREMVPGDIETANDGEPHG